MENSRHYASRLLLGDAQSEDLFCLFVDLGSLFTRLALAVEVLGGFAPNVIGKPMLVVDFSFFFDWGVGSPNYIVFRITEHSEGFTTTSLAIGEDCSVEAANKVGKHWLDYLLIDIGLLFVVWQEHVIGASHVVVNA